MGPTRSPGQPGWPGRQHDDATEVVLECDCVSWDHRAYCVAERIDYGITGTSSRRYIGPMPAADQWVRLEVPASLVNLEGSTLNGMAFSLFNGRATWDL